MTGTTSLVLVTLDPFLQVAQHRGIGALVEDRLLLVKASNPSRA
jgi:hypothetical protein